MNNANRRIARNSILLYIRLGLVLMASLYLTRLLLHSLGIEDYGIYEAVGGIVVIFNVLSQTMATAINRFFNIEIGKGSNGKLSEVYTNSIVAQSIIAVLFVFLVETLGVWYLNTQMVIPEQRMVAANWILQMSVGSFVFMILQVPFSSLILSYERMDFYAIVNIVCTLLKLFGVLAMSYLLTDQLILYGVLILLVSLVNFLFYYVYCKMHFTWLTFNNRIDKKLFKEMCSFVGWSILDPIAYTCRGQGSNMLLNVFFGPLLNAAYGVANQVAVAFDQFAIQLSMAFRPQLIQSYSSGKWERTRELFLAMSKYTYALQLMLCVPLILESKSILHLWLGSNVPDYALTFTCFILVVKTINSLNPPISSVIQATGRIHWYMVSSFVLVSSIVPVSYVLLRMGKGPEIVYKVMVILTVLNMMASVYILSRLFKTISIIDYIKSVFQPLIVLTIIVVLPCLFVHIMINNTILRLFLIAGLSFLMTSLSVYFVLLNSREKVVALSFLLKYLVRK